MADFTIKQADELDSTFGGMVRRARASLGIESFGMQVMNLPPNWDQYPHHDHPNGVPDGSVGQEEVYIPTSGDGTLRVGGEEYRLEPGVFARVGPGREAPDRPGAGRPPDDLPRRRAREALQRPAWTKVGAPPPMPPE